ncbi:MAG TPA: hypothetical protein ENL07_01405 [Chlorobaculum parvum]|uniref:Uncharacterized protein n=1 Tax=Chlorobaculum parvum TaxID=274539 RepID=A0A7C5DHD6_9CHLB|nr:hypothetical protein [Chlorobaculum parvum]
MSDDARALYGGLWDSLGQNALQLAERGSLTVRVYTGSDMPVPPANTTAEILQGLEAWVEQHAQQSEVFEVPLETLKRPSVASKLLDGLWQSVQRFYRLCLKLVRCSGRQ